MADLNRRQATSELGVSGESVRTGYQHEEFLPRLRGRQALRKYQEIADNDAVAGAFLAAIDMILRSVTWEAEPADDSEQARQEAEFVETLFEDMSHTFEEFMSEVLSFLTYGWSFFEVVYKTRQGPEQRDQKRRSKYNDGRFGIRKLAPRSQMTLERWEFDDDGGLSAFVQTAGFGATGIRIPIEKGLLFKTIARNSSPTGRSIFRNAYKSYHYLTNIQNIEAIAIERELNGVPVGYIPAEYLSSNASGDQKAIKNQFEKILRDLKFNEQGFAMLPSDTWQDENGNPTNTRMMEIELMASNGTRMIDTGPVIQRYQQDMARTVLADFIMLGQSDKGSFALSKSKTDLFLTSLDSYLNNIASVINRHLLPRVWKLNGLSYDLMPRMKPGEVAPTDIGELGDFVKALSGSGIVLTDLDTENALRSKADLPLSDGNPEEMLG